MPNCVYCGRPAGLFRRQHAECRAQFDRATTTIPVFFEKLLESALPADRFEQLLKEVAATFHIGPARLHALSIEGINAMLYAGLAQHLLTVEDEDRILEIAGALGFSSDDIPGLDDKLVKISVLRDLEEGQIPDRVTVAGPMPLELEADETIVWIFNSVRSYRPPKSKVTGPSAAIPALQREMPDYFSPASLGEQPVETKGLWERNGDLMVTNENIYILWDDNFRKIPLSDIKAFHTYSNGFQLVRPSARTTKMTFILDDPWFAANLIVRLLRLSSDSVPQIELDDTDIAGKRPQ